MGKITRSIVLHGLAYLVLTATARAQTPPQEQAATQSIQQAFDDATSTLAAEHWADAAQRFETLQGRVSRNPRTLAIVRIRMAVALVELGRIDEARRAAEQGLANLPASEPSLTADRFEALVLLGRIAEAELDYPRAAAQYQAAASLPIGEPDKLIAYRGLIQVQLFDDPAAAIRAADAALAIIAAEAGHGRNLEGQFRTLKGRALLSLRRFSEARSELGAALRLLGDLTLRSDRADLIARGDLALAALLTGNQEDARRYLAFTGQGRMTRDRMFIGSHFVPVCGEVIRPDDVSVIEFSVMDNGMVGHVIPVYASRGATALEFANAVRHWRFNPAEVRDIPFLLRTVVRVELRCSESRPRGPDDDIPDIARFVRERPLRTLPALRAAVQETERGASPLVRVQALIALADHPGIDRTEMLAVRRRALAIAVAGDLDARLIGGLAIQAADTPDWQPRDPEALETIAASPDLHGNVAAAGAVRLVHASALYARGELDRALEIASAVAAMPAVQANPVLGRESNDLLAAIRIERESAAQTSTADDTNCRIARPSRGVSTNPNDFPTDAARWGFEGWAMIEPTVTPEGRVASTRTLIAYPPFVFGDSAARVVRRNRYGRGAASCPGQRIRIRFLLP